MASERVKVAILGPVFQELLDHYITHLSADAGRFVVLGVATNLPQLRQNLTTMQPDVLIIEGLAAEASELVAFLSQECPCPVVLVIPAAWGHMRGQFEALPKVEQVLVEPGVQYLEVINLAWTVGNTYNLKRSAAAPASEVYRTLPGDSRLVLPGLRRFAFWSSKVGVGKTTLAVNFWYRLNQIGVKALLMGFDTPDDIAPLLRLTYHPNSMEFYNRPGPDGFLASIQKKDGFDVILAPETEELAASVAARKASEPNSVESLIAHAASRNYGAIVMDLPPTEADMAVKPLAQATTVVFVALPTFADAVKLGRSVNLLTQRLAAQHRIPKENMCYVLNQSRPGDRFNAESVSATAAAMGSGWCPPLVAAIPFDERVRDLQVDGKLPVVHLDNIGAGVDSLVRNWYGGQVVSLSAAPKKRGLLGKLFGAA